MESERAPQCLLGNGACPKDCRLYKTSAQITTALGENFDPEESRRQIIFADAFNHDIRAGDIAAVIASCAKKGRPDNKPQNPSAPRDILP